MAASMLAVTASSYTDPSKYELSSEPTPAVSDATDVVIEVHAASINPIDVKKASGALKIAIKDSFPYKIGYDAAGIVAAVGDDVKNFKVGDEVFVRLPEAERGSWAEYVKCPEYFVASKPRSISFGDSASLPLAAMTALQALRKYKGSLEGKTVFVPAGLGGTGAYGCQLAKNVFRAGKVITTVSTSKVPQVPELLGEGVVDQIIDYTKNSPQAIIPRGSVDFIFDTTGQAMEFLSLMVPTTSSIVSISTMPSGTQLQNYAASLPGEQSRLSWIPYSALNLMDSISRLRARRWKTDYQYLFLESNGKDLAEIADYVEKGLLKAVVGSQANLKNIEEVRDIANTVYKGRGGIGKAVINVK